MVVDFKVSDKWLEQVPLSIRELKEGMTIKDVIVRELVTHLDGRGNLTELWSIRWADAGFVAAEHVYQTATDFGVIKAWHVHSRHTDQLAVTRGKLQLVLVDLRENSSTFGHVNSIHMGELRPRLVKVPPRVLHGWKSLAQPETIVVNMQSEPYDASDEYRFPWDCILREIWEPRNG